MPRRVHELAKEWGVEPKDLTARLEKIGLRNQRAQSSLTDEEVQRAATELGLGEQAAGHHRRRARRHRRDRPATGRAPRRHQGHPPPRRRVDAGDATTG